MRACQNMQVIDYIDIHSHSKVSGKVYLWQHKLITDIDIEYRCCFGITEISGIHHYISLFGYIGKETQA